MNARRLELGLLVLLAVATTWLLQQMESAAPQAPREGRRSPDFYMEDFRTLTMDEAGRADRRVAAHRMVHFPDTDTNELTRPQMVFKLQQPSPWNVVSEAGWTSPEAEVVLLQGDVRIWQDDGRGGRKLEVLTRNLRVVPDKEYGETDEHTVIRAPWGEARGDGMRAFLAEDRVRLLANVRTVYEPSRP